MGAWRESSESIWSASNLEDDGSCRRVSGERTDSVTGDEAHLGCECMSSSPHDALFKGRTGRAAALASPLHPTTFDCAGLVVAS